MDSSDLVLDFEVNWFSILRALSALTPPVRIKSFKDMKFSKGDNSSSLMLSSKIGWYMVVIQPLAFS